MSIPVRHQHDPAVVVEGADNQKLIIQTGTLVFEFPGSPDEGDWVRKRLTHTVLELPADPLLFFSRISAIASAAPCSMSYSPPNYVRTLLDSSEVGVVIGEEIPPPGPPPPQPLAAGWAVDRTHVTRSFDKIKYDLIVDVAVMGHCSLMRLAYSLFVTIIPPTAVDLKEPSIFNP